MATVFNGSEKIGDIVTSFPGASHLFKKERIDFCCGGDRTLHAVIQQMDMNEEEILNKLNHSYLEAQQRGIDQSVNWSEMNNTDLVDYIVFTHHGYLRKELPLLSEYVTKILRVHGANQSNLLKLHELFHQLKEELEQHLVDEEAFIFPFIKQFDNEPSAELSSEIAERIQKLEADHDAAGNLLKTMRAVTYDYQLPEGACRTYTLTYQMLEGLESDMFQHVHLENNILFQRFANK